MYNICLRAAYWTTVDNLKHYKNNLLKDEKVLRLSATFKLSFRTIFAEQIEPFHVYIYVDWHVEYSTATVANVDAERVVMAVVCCRLTTIRTGQSHDVK